MSNQSYYDNSFKTNGDSIGFNEYLSIFKRNTRLNYCSSLTTYLCFIYPDLRDLPDNENGIRHTEVVDKALQKASIRYLTEERNYRSDLISFREHLKAQKKAPKSISIALTGILGFLGRNNISLNKYDQRDLIKDLGMTITKDKVPTADQLVKLVSFMPIQGKTIVYLLSSSGMRIGECLQLCVEDLSLDSNPARAEILYNGYDPARALKAYPLVLAL